MKHKDLTPPEEGKSGSEGASAPMDGEPLKFPLQGMISGEQLSQLRQKYHQAELEMRMSLVKGREERVHIIRELICSSIDLCIRMTNASIEELFEAISDPFCCIAATFSNESKREDKEVLLKECLQGLLYDAVTILREDLSLDEEV